MAIANKDWLNELTNVTDIDVALDIIYSNLYGMIDKFVPVHRPNPSKYPPWFTPEIKKRY